MLATVGRYSKFKSLNIEVLTVTVDPLNALIKESNKRGITLPVLDDGEDNLGVSKAYNTLDYSMHPGSRPGHSFVLIGKDGNIIWKKDYYPKGLFIGGMNMNIDGRMYVPVNEILQEIYKLKPRLFPTTISDRDGISNSKTVEGSTTVSIQNTTSAIMMNDHSMCSTPIHNHADLKVYLNGVPLNLAQRKYMDQSADVHFHPTVKIHPNDIPGVPFADMVHIHKENITIGDFLNTLDLDANTTKILNDDKQILKVYVNGVLDKKGLDYIMKDKDRILVSYDTNKGENKNDIAKQIESVTSYATIGKDKNPSFFGGC